ncbi:hypothetical protein [Streptomyces sp. NPDC057686]|uniref:hypothetical protein n=1 Tax=Streptomyces sp. NPDC057686 TaxID=3346212 RepID=UPI00369FD6D1
MRKRLLGFTAAVMLAVLGAMSPGAQAATPTVTGPACVAGKGSVEYNAATGLWTCIDGTHNGETID